MAAYKLSNDAKRNLAEIYQYTAVNFGIRQVEKYLLELESVFEIMGDNPKIGRPYKDKTYFFMHGKHIILYRIFSSHIMIGTIFHGSRNR